MKLAKCNNNTSSVTCKPIEEINEYIDNMILTRKIVQPTIDLGYIDQHKYDVKPFDLSEVVDDRQLLHNDKLLFISTSIEKVEVKLDTNLVISDLIAQFYTFH